MNKTSAFLSLALAFFGFITALVVFGSKDCPIPAPEDQPAPAAPQELEEVDPKPDLGIPQVPIS